MGATVEAVKFVDQHKGWSKLRGSTSAIFVQAAFSSAQAIA